MSRQRRHLLITDLLQGNSIRNQHDLRDRLATLGMGVTQATLSRDLRAMGVIKTPDGYRIADDNDTSPHARHGDTDLRTDLITDFVISITVAGQMVVIKTGPGRAQAVAYEVDLNPPEAAVGTVAGDDTLFICTPSRAMGARLGAELSRALNISLSNSVSSDQTAGRTLGRRAEVAV